MRTNPLTNSNRLKLGVFHLNGNSGARTLVPERYRLSWDNILAAAHSVESAERAAQAGFNIVCNQPSKNSAQYIAAFCNAWAGARPAEPLPHIGLNRAIFVAPTREQAIAVAQRAYGAFLHSFRYVTRRHGAQNRVSGLENDFLELMAAGRGVAGTPRDVADFLVADLSAEEMGSSLTGWHATADSLATAR